MEKVISYLFKQYLKNNNKRIIEDVNKKFKRSKKENEVKESNVSSERNFVNSVVPTIENEVKESNVSSERNFVNSVVLTKEIS